MKGAGYMAQQIKRPNSAEKQKSKASNNMSNQEEKKEWTLVQPLFTIWYMIEGKKINVNFVRTYWTSVKEAKVGENCWNRST